MIVIEQTIGLVDLSFDNEKICPTKTSIQGT